MLESSAVRRPKSCFNFSAQVGGIVVLSAALIEFISLRNAAVLRFHLASFCLVEALTAETLALLSFCLFEALAAETIFPVIRVIFRILHPYYFISSLFYCFCQKEIEIVFLFNFSIKTQHIFKLPLFLQFKGFSG
jgi:hypothetical protein